MKILYLGVHYHKNASKWRSETFINESFNKNDVNTIRIDYREILKKSDKNTLKELIKKESTKCDLIFLQRGENLTTDLFSNINIPIIFWSTEPINLKNDVDSLLKSKIFSWIYLHTYSCLDRVKREFPHLLKKSSVLHNALPDNKVRLTDETQKKHFAIFNRNLSLRRRRWLYPSWKYIKIIKNHYGDLYFDDLSKSYISINIHYSSKNLDDFETGIFEAIASNSVVVSERLDKRVLEDLHLQDAIIQVDSPKDLKYKLIYFKENIQELEKYKTNARKAINKNTWTYRVSFVKNKFEEIIKN